MEYHDLLSGFVRLHILHHAAEQEIYGQWIMEELARHGYHLSPGTLYPMLQAMEARGYLTSREDFGRTAWPSAQTLQGHQEGQECTGRCPQIPARIDR